MMRWNISIFTANGRRLIWAAQCKDHNEAAELATEARREHPDVMIFLRSPTGVTTRWH